jgi:uncharacterized RDD family membrane protein YckC
VEYEDQVTVATPEGVELDMTLAGLGSRSVAGSVDIVIKGLLIVVLAILLYVTNVAGGGGAADAMFSVGSFLIYFGYDVAFEVLGGGRTPGKRMSGLRVVAEGGEPVGFRRSAIRNLVRVVDGLATFYMLGAAFILFTKRHQRLGDLAAGTLVVRERRAADRRATSAVAAAAPPPLGAFDVSAVTAQELATVRSFLERRPGLDVPARHRLALQLSERLRPKVVGAPDADGEPFLEWLASAKGASP